MKPATHSDTCRSKTVLVRTHASRGRLQRGAGMLEILVSLLVISIGMLGAAGLASTTFTYNKTAQVRLVGLALAQEYAERARINVYGFDLGSYDIGTSEIKPARTTFAANDANTTATNTAATNVAAHDKAAFMNEVADRLPSGQAIVVSTRSTTTGARDMDIWIAWQEPEVKDGYTNPFADACPTGLSNKSCMYFKVGL